MVKSENLSPEMREGQAVGSARPSPGYHRAGGPGREHQAPKPERKRETTCSGRRRNAVCRKPLGIS